MTRDVALTCLLLILAGACQPAPGIGPNLALERYPPVLLDPAYRSGKGVYPWSDGYRLYLGVDDLRRGETQVSPQTLSLMVEVGQKYSRYDPARWRFVERPGWVAMATLQGFDGEPIHLRSTLPKGTVFGASRRLDDGVVLTYQVHEKRFDDLLDIDERIVRRLRKLEAREGQPAD